MPAKGWRRPDRKPRVGGGANRQQILISIEEFRDQLFYDPETGLFTNLVSRPGSRKVGALVGYRNAYTGYVAVMRGNKNYPAHRLAWAMSHGYWPECIDHINGVRDDNRLCNLRECTRAENAFNTAKRANSSQPYKGIHYHSKHGFWTAQIQVRRKRQYLGSFRTAEEASAAYEAAARLGFGEFKRQTGEV